MLMPYGGFTRVIWEKDISSKRYKAKSMHITFFIKCKHIKAFY